MPDLQGPGGRPGDHGRGDARVLSRNLVNLKAVDKGYGSRSVLRDVTLGIAEGDRVGVVGRNGGGKSTLLGLLGGTEEPDAGAVTRTGGVVVARVAQGDELPAGSTADEVLAGEQGLRPSRPRERHSWERDPRARSVLAGLLRGLDRSTPIGRLSGGERRRIALAQALLADADLLLLDEPTNHLDVEGVDWLARFLRDRRGAMVVVTHDRWFLDAAVSHTWEVSDGQVFQYEGGYAAYTLARAERMRQEASREERRQQLVRKELAWLRRGPPARTSKPKFRIEAAEALIADEPPVRDRNELLRFASARLGGKVLEAEDVRVAFGERRILDGLTWLLGPGDRVALVGVNGSGKTTLMDVLSGTREPDGGSVDRGATVRLAHLTQQVAEVRGDLKVLEAVQEVRLRTTLADGTELTAGRMCERFGFRGDAQRTLVRDLSGGERRRLQLMRLLMDEPNVLLLDEPTNDLDIDTLTALEDLLDSWPGSLVVVSHDRWFVERACDDVVALMGDGRLRHLPGGVEEYLRLRGDALAADAPAPEARQAPAGGGGASRAARKEAARLERALEKLDAREAALHEAMAAAATDPGRLRELNEQLVALRGERDSTEEAWLEAAEAG